MCDTIGRSPPYATNITNSLPLSFFVANPYTNNANLVNNAGWSYYDGLEVEVNRRFAGLVMQATYTYSKVLTDTSFVSSQNEWQNYQSLQNTGLDKFRAGFDTTHAFAANFLVPIPVRPGRKFGSNMNRTLHYVT